MEFLQSLPVSTVVVIVSIILFAVLTYKGMGLIPVSLICAFLVSFVCYEGVLDGFFSLFAEESTSFMKQIIFVFFSAGALGELMSASGASAAIGTTLVRKLGKGKATMIIAVLTIILNLSGMPTVPFIVAPVIFSVFKEANLPRHIGLTVMFGTMQPMLVCLPGAAATTNVLPTSYLGTDILAAPLMGSICFVFALILVAIYTWFLTYDARRRGLGYDGPEPRSANTSGAPLPGFFKSIMCVVIVVVLALGLTMTGWIANSFTAVIIAQIIACVYVMIFFRKNTNEKFSKVVEKGIMGNAGFVVGIGLVVGYASVVTNTAAYDALLGWLTGLNIHPYALTVIACALICGICVNGYGGMGIFLAMLGGNIMAMPGVSAEAVHRLTTMTSTTFDSLPHASSVLINLQCMRMTLKEGYKYCFMTTIVFTVCYTLLGLAIALIAY